jgi:Flp pilus assembly protein TadB
VRNDRSDDTVVVTSAKLSHTDDIALRQRRYILTQSVRVICVVLATTLPIPLIWKGVFVLGAVALPWFGVVMANAGPTVSRRRKSAMVDTPVEQPLRIAIEPGRVIDAER